MSAPSAPPRRTARPLAVSLAIDALILAAATVGTFFALDRPRTAVLIYVLGVLIVGARSGLYRGVVAALVASFIYNFFLSEPRFRFGASSFDELVPILAFNVSAIVSGGLAGRLQDRARAAREAEAKNQLLLALSDSLQSAIAVDDVERIAADVLAPTGIETLAIELGDGSDTSMQTGVQPGVTPIALAGSGGRMGTAYFGVRPGAAPDREHDLQAVGNLLALAADRCQLLEQLSETKAAQRSEELKNALLSSVSHDLRTPLTAIEAAATSLKSLRSTLGRAQQAELLDTITEQCAKLNRYTANLLDMSRIQAGIPSSQLTSVDVVEILGVALAAARRRFPLQAISKEVSQPSVAVAAQAAMLEQLIFNLLENAVVHGGDGKPILVRLTAGKDQCVLEVTDSGPGIAPPAQARVFERFYRGENASREGSGLGLYIAKGFVEAFGGTIAIHSPVIGGSGTTVTVCLPLIEQAEVRLEAADARPGR